MSVKIPAVEVDEAQVRAFRAQRGHLWGPGAADLAAAARAVAGIQAQQEAPALWSVAMRTAGRPTAAAVRVALYEARTLVRTWGQRDTVHVYDPADWLDFAAADPVLPASARRGPHPSADDLDAALAALAALDRPVTRAELAAVHAPAEVVALFAEHAAEGEARAKFAAYRLIWALAHRGDACYATKAGSEQRYATRAHWLPGLAWPAALPEAHGAAARLVRRYLAVNGPASANDVAHFLGGRVSAAKGWLGALGD
ncbi:MAG: crosslink repair DNA glycosylase YcaQ family protein, partial [bacterium]